MRMVVLRHTTDLAELRERLLSARLGDAQAERALETLERMNPHVDLRKLRPGTVLLVPEATGFKTSGSGPMVEDAVDDFAGLLKSAVAGAGARARSAAESRAAELAEITRVAKAASVRRLVEQDPAAAQELHDGLDTLRRDAAGAEQAVQQLADMGDAALQALAVLTEVLHRT